MQIPSGLHTNLSEGDYRALDAVNQSSLKEILRSPAHYKALLDDPSFKQTASMEFGSALHCWILEPKKFETRYAVGPLGITDRRTKAWKDFEKDVGDRTIISHDDYLGFLTISEQIKADHQLNYLFAEGLSEVTVVWEDGGSGVRCKARLDFVTPSSTIVDLKSSKDARRFSFSRSMFDYGYHIQAAFYIDALCAVGGLHKGQVPFKFVVVENKKPWAIKIYRIGEKSIELGRAKYRAALGTIKKCREMNLWPAYQINESEIDVPSFALGEDDGVEDAE